MISDSAEEQKVIEEYKELIVRRTRRVSGLLPSHLAIETTNICNSTCKFCPSIKQTRKKGVMDFDLFKKIIDDASQYGDAVNFISYVKAAS